MKSSKYCSRVIDDEVELKTNDLLKVRKASKADKQKGRSPQYCKSARECCFQLNTQPLFFPLQDAFTGLLAREGRTKQLGH